jgi:hypothetical protein
MAGVQLPVAQYFARLGFVKDGFRAVLAGYIHKPELLEAIVDVSFLIKDRNVDSEESIVFGGYSARVDQARRSGMNSSVEFRADFIQFYRICN